MILPEIYTDSLLFIFHAENSFPNIKKQLTASKGRDIIF